MQRHQKSANMAPKSDVTELLDSFGSWFDPSEHQREMQTPLLLVIGWSEGGTAVPGCFSYKVNYPSIFLKI